MQDKLVQDDLRRTQLTSEEAKRLDEGLALDKQQGMDRMFEAFYTNDLPGAKELSKMQKEALKKGVLVSPCTMYLWLLMELRLAEQTVLLTAS